MREWVESIHSAVNGSGPIIAFKQPSHCSHSLHPQHLRLATCIGRTFPGTVSQMATLLLFNFAPPRWESRVDLLGLTDDEAVANQLAHRVARTRHRELALLVGVHPHLPTPALHHLGGDALLDLEAHHVDLSLIADSDQMARR